MNLVIDIGNSSTKVALFDKGEMISHFKTEKLTFADILALKSSHKELSLAILSSVSVDDQDFAQKLHENFDFFIRLDHHTPLPIQNCYKTPATLGLDRIAAAAGAAKLFPERDILVIDAGTAITFDIVDSQGRFLGGNISPGIWTRFRALHHFTKKLPLCDQRESWPILGATTCEAIEAGVLNGVIFEVEGMINKMLEIYPKIITVITGGDSNFFDKKLKNPIFAQFDVTLTGLNYILEYNYNAIEK